MISATAQNDAVDWRRVLECAGRAPVLRSSTAEGGQRRRRFGFAAHGGVNAGYRRGACTESKAAVVSLLTPTLSAARAVADYRRVAQPDDTDTADAWSAYFVQNPAEGDYLRYDGPAGFSVSFGERVARVSGPCRWSGFSTMAALRQPHAAAFR